MEQPRPITLRSARPLTLRRLARNSALELAYGTMRVTGRIESALRKPRVQHLYLHHLFDDEVPGLRFLLETVSRSHTLISYSQAVDLVQSGTIDRPYVAVSFDDAFKSNVEAARILREYGVSACFFVPTDFVGLSDPDRVRGVCRDVFHMPPVGFMSWDDLELLLTMGHEIGSHTADHSRLSSLSREEAESTIARSVEALRIRLGGVSHFAWPYGNRRDVTSDNLRFVQSLGFRSVASAERGCHTRPLQPGDYIRRDVVVAGRPVRETVYFMARNSWRSGDAEAA